MDRVSDLWGTDGERWDPRGPLPDFSFAGYARGERPIPDVPVTADVRQFGARGDGEQDDTAAFRRALAETPNGTILVPGGRYVITDILDITRGNIVLRGEGPATTLHFPKYLNDVRPDWGATTGGRPTSNYSWSGGYLWAKGSFGGRLLADISTEARRGDDVIALVSTDGIRAGQEIEIRVEDDTENSLATHLYAGDPGDVSELKGTTRAEMTCRVARVEGDRVRLDRPLRFDVDRRWRPRVLAFEPTVRDVGIERLRFEFPRVPYAGHFTELGHNAIAFDDVADCWVRDVIIDHCDSGVFGLGRFCTFDGVTYNSARPVDGRFGAAGHHGVYLGGDDNLFTRFRFNTKFIHDLTVSRCAGNVFSRGTGVDVCLDHHKRAPHANLFTDIDLGDGSRPWPSGGGDALGKHCAAWGTFWNLRANNPIATPFDGFGPKATNLVGLGRDVTPADLHAAQLARRLGR